MGGGGGRGGEEGGEARMGLLPRWQGRCFQAQIEWSLLQAQALAVEEEDDMQKEIGLCVKEGGGSTVAASS